MQKPWAPAIDLADHDVVEDDGDLVVGPLFGRLSTGSVSATPSSKQIGSSSFKDNSILGSASVTAKLGLSISVPAPSSLASRLPSTDNNVYAGGNPIIASASTSRPSSASLRQPRTSAPSGGMVPCSDRPTSSPSAHGSLAPDSGEEGRLDGAEPRMQGDILGGERDDSTPQKKGLLRRFSSSRHPTLTTTAATAAKHGGADTSILSPKGSFPGADGSCNVASGSRLPAERSIAGRGAILPGVDVEPERRQLLRRLSVNDPQSTLVPVVAMQPQVATATSRPAQGPPGDVGATGSRTPAAVTSGAAGGAQPTGTAAVAELPTTHGGLLSRLLSGSPVSPGPCGAQGQDGAGGGKGRSSGMSGLRELFSRPSSARRKSEVGAGQPPPPFVAWKQQRHSHTGQSDDRDVQEGTAGGERPPSGLLKRTASALAAAWAR